MRSASAWRLPLDRPGGLSYSTVVTIVSRLHAKGLLARQRAGRGFTYHAGRRRQPGGQPDDAGGPGGEARPRGRAQPVRVRAVRTGTPRLLRELLGTDDGEPAGRPGRPGTRVGPCGCCCLPLVIPALAGAGRPPAGRPARAAPRHLAAHHRRRGPGRVQHGRAGAARGLRRRPGRRSWPRRATTRRRSGAAVTDPVAAGVAAALALLAHGRLVAAGRCSATGRAPWPSPYRRAAGLSAEDGIVVVPGPAIEAYALPGVAGPHRGLRPPARLPGRPAPSRADRPRAGAPGQLLHHLFATVAPARRRGQPAAHPGGPRGGLHAWSGGPTSTRPPLPATAGW